MRAGKPLHECQPDVIVLQEMVSEARHDNDAEFAYACSRVKHLEGILEADGFSFCSTARAPAETQLSGRPSLSSQRWNLSILTITISGTKG